MAQGDLDIAETRTFKDFTVRVAETEGRRRGQEDAFFATSPNSRPADEVPDFMTEVFRQTQQKTDGMQSGATATVANIGVDNTLTFAHLGDSPAMLFVQDGKTGEISVHNLLKEHKLSDPEEQRLVEARGGTVINYHGMRVMGNDGGAVAVSRALGDANYPGVGHEPEINQFKLNDFVKPGDRAFLCLSCDGLLEVNRPEDYVAILKDRVASGKTENIADSFVQHAFDSGSRDNITAMVTEIPVNRDRDLMFGIMDGHGGKDVAQMAAENMKKLSVKPTAQLLAERDQQLNVSEEPTLPPTMPPTSPPTAPPTLPPTELSAKPPVQNPAPDSSVPDSIDLGEGFSLGKKEFPDGTSVYRIVPPNGKSPLDGVGLAQKEGFLVHYVDAGNGMSRIGMTPEEFANAWEARQNISPPQTEVKATETPDQFTSNVAANVQEYRARNEQKTTATNVLDQFAAQLPGELSWVEKGTVGSKQKPHFRMTMPNEEAAIMLHHALNAHGIPAERAEKDADIGKEYMVMISKSALPNIQPENLAAAGRTFIRNVDQLLVHNLNNATSKTPGTDSEGWKIDQSQGIKARLYTTNIDAAYEVMEGLESVGIKSGINTDNGLYHVEIAGNDFLDVTSNRTALLKNELTETQNKPPKPPSNNPLRRMIGG